MKVGTCIDNLEPRVVITRGQRRCAHVFLPHNCSRSGVIADCHLCIYGWHIGIICFDLVKL